MLALRLTRGGRPAAQLRRLVLAVTAAGTGFLLLTALAFALGHPDEGSQALLRLAWCALPLAVTAQLAVAVARADPMAKPRSALDAAHLETGRVRGHAAASTAIAALLGAALALLLFLHLRGDLAGLPFDGRAADALAAGEPLPVAGALTLLALVPLSTAGAGALAVRPVRVGRPAAVPERVAATAGAPPAPAPAAEAGTEREAGAGGAPPAPPAPMVVREDFDAAAAQPSALLPWGAALLAAGTAVGSYAARGITADAELPAGLDALPAGVLVGWLLTAAGLVLTGPGLVLLTGRALAFGRPGVLRLLAGREIQLQARAIGTQLATVCVAAAALLVGVRHGGAGFFGPVTALGAAVVLLGVVAAASVSVAAARADRAPAAGTLRWLGASPTLLRRCGLLRAAALLAVFGPLSWCTAWLLELPLR